MSLQYRCKNVRRQAGVRDKKPPVVNGIDYLEVVDGSSQVKLKVYFLHDLPGTWHHPVRPDELTARIEGGERIRGIRVNAVESNGKVLTVTVDRPGDFSTYRLRLVDPSDDLELKPPKGFDPQLSEVDFSFKVECPSDFDCKQETACPPQELPEAEIDYLAKDYSSFRRLMLDQLSALLPDWKERNPADVQIALVELLAYVADYLSYYQDAVATEAYLGTARKRTSVRRQARLLDYPMHDGANARAWVAFYVDKGANGNVLPGPKSAENHPGTLLVTKTAAPPGPITKEQRQAAEREGAQFFETLHDVMLWKSHNEIRFYSWGDRECCLPAGATRAFLLEDENSPLMLRRGDVLIFEERLDPKNGQPEDANPEHRHAVRLTKVFPEAALTKDGRTRKGVPSVADPVTDECYVQIAWDVEDALPFPLCLSTVADGAPVPDVSMAVGNVVLVDHGLTATEENPLPKDEQRPRLARAPITQQANVLQRTNGKMELTPVDPGASAAAAFQREMFRVLPAVRLFQKGSEDRPWVARRDLLASDRFAREFVVEIEEDGTATLRFGDDVLGQHPEEDVNLFPTYRVGNGRAGNVGREAISHVVTDIPGILSLRNPMPARGGIDPESMEQVRQYAPQAFRVQQRAVTEDDYAAVAQRHPGIQRGAATLRWTGSWYTAFVTADRQAGLPVDPRFEEEMIAHFERYRMAGFDLEIDSPQFVSLDLALHVCVKQGYFQSSVKKALLDVLGSRDLPIGTRGFFHPDNFTFGQPVYLSRIYRAAMQVDGVASVEVLRFQRWGRAPNRESKDGLLTLGRLEIARLDNDPNFPERGRLELVMGGGL